MIWIIDPDDIEYNIGHTLVRDIEGKPVAAPVALETAIELVNEHNTGVYRAMAAGLGMPAPVEREND